MATISTLAVNLIARTSVFEKGMRRSRKSMRGFQATTVATTARLAAFTGGLLASGGAILALRSFTNAASRAQETMNLFNTVFAENAAETAKWANEFATNVGRSKTEVKEWAATLQDTFVPLGFARDKAAELSKTLVQVAVDVGSFKNIASDAEVINAFTSAIVGNGRAVRAYGVVLTNSTIEMESFASGLNKTFTQLTELEKVQLRFNIIMKSTKDAQGDAVKTADNYANRVKKLKGQIEDLKESFGNALLPTMTKMVTFMNDKMVPIFNKLSRVFSVTVRFLKSNTVKYLAWAGAIVFTVRKIRLLITWIKGLNLAYRAATIARTILSAVMGPKGWVTIAVGVGVATAAIVSLNNAMKDTAANMANISASAKKNLSAASVTVEDFRNEVARRQEFLTRIKTTKKVSLSEGDRDRLIRSAQKRLNISRMSLVQAIQQRRVLKDIANIERERTLQQARNLSGLKAINEFVTGLQQEVDSVGLSSLEAQLLGLEKLMDGLEGEAWKEFNKGTEDARRLIARLTKEQNAFRMFERDIEDAKQLKESIITPGEARIKQIERINNLLTKGLITLEDQQKAIAGIDVGGEISAGRFQEIRSEFVDVAALNAGRSERGIDKNNQLTEESNRLLNQLVGNSRAKAAL